MTLSKYEELMEKVEVTPEMRERVEKGIEKELAADSIMPTHIVDITRKKGFHSRKRLSLAACFALLLLAGIVLPRLLHPVPDYSGDETQVIPEIAGWSSTEELSEKMGFPVSDIAFLKEQAEETAYLSVWDIAEIQYTTDDHLVTYRKSLGNEDNSGVYETYEQETTETVNGQQYILKGNGTECSLILWTDEEYSYSIYFEEAVPKEQAETIIKELSE